MWQTWMNWWRDLWMRTSPLSEWYWVEFDEQNIYVEADPPGKAGWEYQFRWQDIRRVCFEGDGMNFSDCLYIWVQNHEHAYMIPIEANGGSELFLALNQRGLFPDDMMLKAASSTDGSLYCYPALEDCRQPAQSSKESQNFWSNLLFYVFYAFVLVLCVLSIGKKYLHGNMIGWQYLMVLVMIGCACLAPNSWHRQRQGDAVSAVVVMLILLETWF